MIRLGIDLGGTKIEALAIDETGVELVRKRVPTPRAYEAGLLAITELVSELEREIGKSMHVGIGHPGSLSPATGLMRNANSTWLNETPFKSDLEARLGRAIRLANDADCFALSEAVDGAGRDYRTVFGVIIGTGVGGGIVVDRTLHTGAQRIAGEWGHNPLPWMSPDEFPGPRCWCGRVGCIETFLSGPGWASIHNNEYASQLTAEQIATDPSEQCVDSRADYAARLGRALASVINIIDADCVVLGGGVSNTPGLAQAVETRLAEWVFSDICRTRVVTNQHGDSSGVRGAAWLWGPDE
ncbi:ROK family protein [Maricaulis sp.]|uniref:ROK family protein n=1 Tax=unclassified Maricaulis TaxID=2632371 RepID=UPI001B1AC2FA|nr:ROK family protein [Maricaulis sp.]MBO6798300.1 ROK family protein [Maricaulis sp.]